MTRNSQYKVIEKGNIYILFFFCCCLNMKGTQQAHVLEKLAPSSWY